MGAVPVGGKVAVAVGAVTVGAVAVGAGVVGAGVVVEPVGMAAVAAGMVGMVGAVQGESSRPPRASGEGSVAG